MNDGDPDARKTAWSAYWAGGPLHSCVGSYASNYDGVIGDFWAEVLAGLPAPAAILDLATGNGALPLLLWERLGDSIEIDAVDLAQLAPSWYDCARHGKIRFRSGVAMESLPFPDASFDLVTSQFGIEYADWPRALAECMRVCKPGGEIALAMHHADSVLMRVAKSELAHQHRLLAEGGLLDAVERVLPWMARAQREGAHAVAGEAAAHRSRQAYNAAITDIAEVAAADPVPDLLLAARDWAAGLVARPQQANVAAVKAYRGALEAARLRTVELIACARTPMHIDEAVACFREMDPHLGIACMVLRQEQGILAWGVRLRRGMPA